MESKDRLESYGFVFDEKGPFGGSQLLPEKDPLKYVHILKKHKKYRSDEQAANFLKRLASEGCGYVALVNTIFLHFYGHEEEFQKAFGYSMLDPEGKPNFNELAVDFYCTTDNHNRFLMFDYIDPNEDMPYEDGYGTTKESSKYRFEHYMKKHGIRARLNPIRLKPRDIEMCLEKGPIIVSVRPMTLYDINGKAVQKTKNGHTMSVVGITESGLVRVSSWGKEFFVKTGTYERYEYYQQVVFRDKWTAEE